MSLLHPYYRRFYSQKSDVTRTVVRACFATIALSVAFVLTFSQVCGQTVTTPIRNGKLQTDLDANSFTVKKAAGLQFGTGTIPGSPALLQFSSGLTGSTAGIWWGEDLGLYRSASGQLTIAGDVAVTGELTGTGVPTAASNNTWTGTNTFQDLVTMEAALAVQDAGITFTSVGRSTTRTALQLVPGTHVQAFSTYLNAIATNPAFTAGGVFVGNGTNLVYQTGDTLRSSLGLGTTATPTFSNLTLSGTLQVTGLSTLTGGLTLPSAIDQTNGLSINGAKLWATTSTALATNAGFTAAGTVAGNQVSSTNNLTAGGYVSVGGSTDTRWYNDSGVIRTPATVRAAAGVFDAPLPVTSGGTGLASVADGVFLYTSASNTFSAAPLTAYGRALIAAADATEAKGAALLDLETIATTGAAADLTTQVPVSKGGTNLTTVAADRILYTSALDTFTATSITAYGRTLIGLADAAALQTNLSLAAIALSGSAADLTTAVAVNKGGTGLTTITADHMLYASALDTISSFATTSYGRSLLNAADAAALRTLAGLGDSAVLNVGTTTGTVAAGDDARFHNAVTVTDSDTVNLTVTVQDVAADVVTQMSVTSDASGVKLSGDSASPGNLRYYGTDGAGAKGFHNFPDSSSAQLFTSDATWTNPSPGTAKMVFVKMVGGGGGGGSGGLLNSGSIRGGGGGGGGACVVEFWTMTTALGATEAVVVGQGGSGGAPKTTNGNGNAGSDGTSSTFAGVTARFGEGGDGGTTGTANGGPSSSVGSVISIIATSSAAGGASSSDGSTAPITPSSYGPTGGGGGGGVTSGNVAGEGANGGSMGNTVIGTVAGGTIVAGDAGGSGNAGRTFGTGGAGGAGRATAGLGFAGGNGGGYGSGGGGGGGATSTGESGAGGDGAPGYVLIVVF